jgi:hypothetical protein
MAFHDTKIRHFTFHENKYCLTFFHIKMSSFLVETILKKKKVGTITTKGGYYLII